MGRTALPDAVVPGAVAAEEPTPPTIDCAHFARTYPKRTQQSLAVDPRDPDIVYVGVEEEGFFKSVDGGRRWARSDAGIRAFLKRDGGGRCFPEFYATAIDPLDPRHVCVSLSASPGTPDIIQAAYQGVYCSQDGGANWNQRVQADMNTAVLALAMKPDQPEVLFAGTNANPSTFVGADPGHLYNSVGIVHRSDDGGRRWRELATGLVRGMRVTSIRIDPRQTDTVYASTMGLLPNGGNDYLPDGFGLLKSVDGGQTWTAQKNGLGPETKHLALMRVEVSPRAAGHLLVSAADGGFFLSTDGGASFRRPEAPTNQSGIMQFDPTDPDGLRVLSLSQVGTELVESLDGGDHWRSIGPLPAGTQNNGDPRDPTGVRPSDLEISPSDANVLYLSGSHGTVYRSGDGGRSWTQVLSAERLPMEGAESPGAAGKAYLPLLTARF